jgi:hypothetical protein
MSVDYCGCSVCWSLTAPVGEGVTLETSSTAPPFCEKHKRNMVLGIYDRPGSPPAHGWFCPACADELNSGSLWAATLGGTGASPGTPVAQPQAQPTIFDLVKRDLDERDRRGYEQHRVALTAGRGYDWLQQAYEEALDLCVYLRGALTERWRSGDGGRSVIAAAFYRMSQEELEEFAKTGKLPEWFLGALAEREGK